MADVNNKLYSLVKFYGKNLPEEVPEGILYGYIKISSMSDEELSRTLENNGLDVESVKKDLDAAREVIKSHGLDIDLLKSGLQLVLPKRADDTMVKLEYGVTVMEYDDSVTMKKIIEDVITCMPKEEVRVFSTGSSLADIAAYIKTLPKESPDSRDGSGPEEKPRTEETERDDDGPQGKNGDPIEIYSDVLAGYLDNLKKIIPYFREDGKQSLLWSQSLLLSIDDGYGVTTFIRELTRIYTNAGLCYDRNMDYILGKYRLDDNGGRESRFADWDAMAEMFKNISKHTDRDNKLHHIIEVDLSKWTTELDTAKIREYLTGFNDVNSTILFVFRIPYMEHRIVNDIARSLSDVIRVRPLIVHPADNDQMIRYMRRKAAGYGYTFAPDCDDVLERGIVAEKNDGSFYGFNTLKQMVESILYDRISDEAMSRASDTDKEITAEEVKRYLNISYDDKTADELIAGMVGVKPIIEQVEALINQIKVQQQMSEHGRSLERPTIHMAFTGSPGTGKTTIARIIAKKMKEAGILSKGNFYEIKGRDLCGQYIGETTPKTCGYCRSAYGSVLFIDEAYELYRSAPDSKDYGREAITALIAEMENHRDDMCVIMAGYTEEMKTLLESNPGLKSRIRTTIEFPNYNREELEGIYFNMIGDAFDYDDEFKDAVHDYFSGLEDEIIEDKTFANGRFVRNLYENTWGVAALRSEFDEGGRLKLRASDFNQATDKTDAHGTVEEFKRRPMGFGAF
ncbi:MAG: AAA family ATPase [Lachnospiraceae bacterium]|nr:AAA family ATPase [Lachnospiraceae bacterium]